MASGLLALLSLAFALSACTLTTRSLEGDFKRNFLEMPKFRF
jgi:hypothetical protein